jgi:hypothetical protein
VETNQNYVHQIVLNPRAKSDNTVWLGITFRQSKTFIYFKNEIPYFSATDQCLVLATEAEEQEFYKNKFWENKTMVTEMVLMYTLSPGDLHQPKNLHRI